MQTQFIVCLKIRWSLPDSKVGSDPFYGLWAIKWDLKDSKVGCDPFCGVQKIRWIADPIYCLLDNKMESPKQ